MGRLLYSEDWGSLQSFGAWNGALGPRQSPYSPASPYSLAKCLLARPQVAVSQMPAGSLALWAPQQSLYLLCLPPQAIGPVLASVLLCTLPCKAPSSKSVFPCFHPPAGGGGADAGRIISSLAPGKAPPPKRSPPAFARPQVVVAQMLAAWGEAGLAAHLAAVQAGYARKAGVMLAAAEQVRNWALICFLSMLCCAALCVGARLVGLAMCTWRGLGQLWRRRQRRQPQLP